MFLYSIEQAVWDKYKKLIFEDLLSFFYYYVLTLFYLSGSKNEVSRYKSEFYHWLLGQMKQWNVAWKAFNLIWNLFVGDFALNQRLNKLDCVILRPELNNEVRNFTFEFTVKISFLDCTRVFCFGWKKIVSFPHLPVGLPFKAWNLVSILKRNYLISHWFAWKKDFLYTSKLVLDICVYVIFSQIKQEI